MEVITESAEETKGLGRKIAADLITDYRLRITDYARVFALTGDLGSGKTTFVQGFAEGLGIKTRIISPTFIIVRKYDIPISHQSSVISHFYHIDLYRLETEIETEIRNLGVNDVWSIPGNIVVIEWAEKIKNVIPKTATWVRLKTLGEDERKITIHQSPTTDHLQ